MNRHDEGHRHVTARAMSANIRHRAYGRTLSDRGSVPLPTPISTFVPGIGSINSRNFTYGAKRAFQHDPSER